MNSGPLLEVVAVPVHLAAMAVATDCTVPAYLPDLVVLITVITSPDRAAAYVRLPALEPLTGAKYQ